jgi:hypothetical protein
VITSSKFRRKAGFDFQVGANLLGMLYKLGNSMSPIRRVILFFNGGFELIFHLPHRNLA